MNNIIRKVTILKQPKPGRGAEHEEFGREKGGIAECTLCHNVHFKKRWYPSLAVLQEQLQDKKLQASRKEICPACRMVKEHLFEGELFVEGFPVAHKADLLNLIKNFGQHATEIDPQHRIIKIGGTAKKLYITTTENQMADRLARKIRDAFKTVKIHFSHSKEPYEVDRIHATFYKK